MIVLYHNIFQRVVGSPCLVVLLLFGLRYPLQAVFTRYCYPLSSRRSSTFLAEQLLLFWCNIYTFTPIYIREDL